MVWMGLVNAPLSSCLWELCAVGNHVHNLPRGVPTRTTLWYCLCLWCWEGGWYRADWSFFFFSYRTPGIWAIRFLLNKPHAHGMLSSITFLLIVFQIQCLQINQINMDRNYRTPGIWAIRFLPNKPHAHGMFSSITFLLIVFQIQSLQIKSN